MKLDLYTDAALGKYYALYYTLILVPPKMRVFPSEALSQTLNFGDV